VAPIGFCACALCRYATSALPRALLVALPLLPFGLLRIHRRGGGDSGDSGDKAGPRTLADVVDWPVVQLVRACAKFVSIRDGAAGLWFTFV
jgi:hypothetical protein